MNQNTPKNHSDTGNFPEPPAPRRYQNHVTRLAWLPQLLQNIEADVTDRETLSNGHKRRRGKRRRTTNAKLWVGQTGGQTIGNQRIGGKTLHMMGLGKDDAAAKGADVNIGIEALIFNKVAKKYQDTTSTNNARAYLFKQVSRVFIACMGMALHDQKTDMFVENPKGTFALVGLRSDGSTRHLNRLKSYMGKHLCSPELTERLWDILEILKHTHLFLNGKDLGPALDIIEAPMQLKGSDLNALSPGQHVRGGTWRIAQINPELMDMNYKKFMQLDTQCFKLCDQDFNLYVYAKSQHHMKFGKQTGKGSQRLEFKSNELMARAGMLQLTQKSTWQEKRCLKRALTRMKALGLIEDFGFERPTLKRDKDVWIVYPARDIPV